MHLCWLPLCAPSWCPGFFRSRCQKWERTAHLTPTQASIFSSQCPVFFFSALFCGQVVIFCLEGSVRLPRVTSGSALSDFAWENTHSILFYTNNLPSFFLGGGGLHIYFIFNEQRKIRFKFYGKVNQVCFLSAESNWTLCSNGSAGQLEEEISSVPCCSPGAQTLIMRIISSSPHQKHWLLSCPPAHTASLRHATCIRFSLSLAPCHCSQRTQGQKMAISPLLFQTWSAWKLPHLCQARVHAFKCLSDLDLTPPANQAQRKWKKKEENKVVSLFLPHSETSVWHCYSQRMRQKDSHSF